LNVETVVKGVLILHRIFFSSAVDGKVSKPEAIFRPPLTKRRLYDVIFYPPWTSEDFDWWKMAHIISWYNTQPNIALL